VEHRKSLPVLDRRLVLLGSMAAVATAGSTFAARAAASHVLIMVDEPGCHYCRKFDAEIGRGYPRTAEARFAPLVRVRRKAPELKGLAPVIYTPTFILMRGGAELGRITGYPGAEFFYSELEALLSTAGYMRGLTRGPSAT
jgi:hypothetical protein